MQAKTRELGGLTQGQVETGTHEMSKATRNELRGEEG
jgi:hypothetical protein